MRRTPDAMTLRDDRLGRREFLTRAAAAGLGAVAAPRLMRADEPGPARGGRISYFVNGEIHVNVPGRPEGTPLTTGHMDFKPSWSKTGDMLVCFRRTKDDPVTVKWKSTIFIINVDGTGFHQLTDGTRTDFNPTWTRDGRNTPIWNRKNDKTGGFFVMQGRVGGQPGQEVAITDEGYHTWAYSSLTDGRLLVGSRHPTLGWGYFLMTRRDGAGAAVRAHRLRAGVAGPAGPGQRVAQRDEGLLRVPEGFRVQGPGRTLYIADFDATSRRITNLKAIANKEGKPYWFAYPRWIEGEAAVVNGVLVGQPLCHPTTSPPRNLTVAQPAAAPQPQLLPRVVQVAEFAGEVGRQTLARHRGGQGVYLLPERRDRLRRGGRLRGGFHRLEQRLHLLLILRADRLRLDGGRVLFLEAGGSQQVALGPVPAGERQIVEPCGALGLVEFQQHHGRLHRTGGLHADALLLPVVSAGREEHGVHLGPLAVLVVQVEVHAVGVALARVEVAPCAAGVSRTTSSEVATSRALLKARTTMGWGAVWFSETNCAAPWRLKYFHWGIVAV